MATSIYPFNKLQVGMEVISTKGTLVPATRLIDCDAVVRENIMRYRSNYPRGVRSRVGGAGVAISNVTEFDITTELTAEEILWPLLTGIKGGVTGSVVDTTAYTWTFTPELTTAVQTINTATVEAYMSDGATAHYYGESGYGMTRSFRIDWAVNQEARLSWQMFGRARQTGTVTAGLAAYTGREVLRSNLLKVYLDTTWAGLGGTQLATIVRSASFECVTGLEPDYTLDGRSDADFTNHKGGVVAGKLNMVLELDATGAARAVQDFRDNDIVFVRLINTGSLAGAATSVRTVRIDGAYRFASPPSFSRDGEQILAAMDLESVYDPTGTATLEFTAINTLSAVA